MTFRPLPSALSGWAAMFKHLLHNARVLVIVAAALGIAGAILVELKFGLTASGVPVSRSPGLRSYSAATTTIPAWWLAGFPGFAIFITVS